MRRGRRGYDGMRRLGEYVRLVVVVDCYALWAMGWWWSAAHCVVLLREMMDMQSASESDMSIYAQCLRASAGSACLSKHYSFTHAPIMTLLFFCFFFPPPLTYCTALCVFSS